MTRMLTLVLSISCALSVAAQELTLSRYAGSFPDGFDDGSGAAARFHGPAAVAVDASGNVFVADAGNDTIRKISPSGDATTLAGLPGIAGASDGPASVATFSSPSGISVDAAGNVFVADTGNGTIRKISAGIVTTVAGAAGQAGSADGVGASARFDQPAGLALDSAGNLYVADTGNDTIRKIAPDGTVTTIAGSPGVAGAADGTGAAASFYGPSAVAVDASGNVFVADTSNDTIRKITPSGAVSTVAGSPMTSGSTDGVGAAALFFLPSGIAVDGSGNALVADSYNRTIRRVAPDGTVTTVAGVPGSAGSADGAPSAGRLGLPVGVALDPSGALVVADQAASEIRRMAPDGTLSTIAGAPTKTGERGAYPAGLAADGSGNLFVADTQAHTIDRISTFGAETVFAGTAGVAGSSDGNGSAASFTNPSGVAVDASGNVWVADSGNATIRRITPAGDVTTVAGLAGSVGSADGAGSAARFDFPQGIAIDGNGNAWVADTENCTIRKVTASGDVATVAGLAGACGYADGVGSAASFDQPSAIAVGPDGAVYVADTQNERVRKIDVATGAVTTLAGGAFSWTGASLDGRGSGASFALIRGIAVAPDGTIFVAENDGLVRRVAPDGTVTTAAGDASIASEREGTGREALLYSPIGIAADGSGNLFVSDPAPGVIYRAVRAIPDAATIDAPTGLAGQTRQLGTTAATASSWSWRVAERPAGSTAALSSSSIANPTFVPDVEGRYAFVLVASSAAGSRISHVDLFVSCTDSPAQPIALAAGTVPVCPGGSVTLSAGSAWNSFLWSTGETTPTITVSPAATTTYTVVGYAADCTGPAATYTVPVSAALQSSSASIAGSSTVCPDATGGTASVTDFGGVGVSHQWGYRTAPGGSIHPIAGATGATYVVNGADIPVGGNPFYLVCVSTSSCGESVVSNDVAGSIKAAPDATITAPSVLCPNAGGTASVPDAGAGASYSWTISGGHVVSGAGTRSIDFAVDGSSPATIGVTITGANGCSSSGSASVAVDNGANAAISAASAVCAGSGGNSASAVSNLGNSYAWTISGGTITSGSGTPNVVFSAGGGASVVLGLTVQTSNGCTASSTATIPVNPLPSSAISAASSVCGGSSSTASTAAQAGATYAWTISGGTITAGQGTNAVTYTAGASGSVTLGVTVAVAGGCSSSSSATVAINAPPSASITAPSSIKARQKGSASVPNAGSGATYAWTITNGTITSGNGTPSVNFTAGSRGTMTLGVTVRNASGCSASGTKAVTVN